MLPTPPTEFPGPAGRATFFAGGDTVAARPGIAQAIVEAGHEVASHSMTHAQPFVTLTGERARRA
ncbi:MAG: polysaccharide deacetylase family protein [Planctomycetota bacterium]